MKTILYKKMFNKYRIAEIRDSQSPERILRFEEPIEAKLFIGKDAFTVSGGIAKIQASHLNEGEVRPKLYTGTGKEDIEGFIASYGEIMRTSPDSEFAKTVGEAVIDILQRLSEHEKDISQIKNRLDQKLKF